MANAFDGGLCLIYTGLYAAKTDIAGQGDASLTHNGAPIELNNKSSGGWRVNGDNMISTKSLDIDMEVTASSDASYETLIAAAFAGTSAEYSFEFTDSSGTEGYYYEGIFTPVLTGESAAKDTAVTATIQFQSSGQITRAAITP